MEPTANPEQIIQYIQQPAFLVKDGIVTVANDAACKYQIKVGTPIIGLITLGTDDYLSFSSGKLYLELKTGRAWVSVCGDTHLFCMDESYSSPELRAFALAAQHLRAPLSNAVSGTELLLKSDTLQNEDLKKQLGQINRSLYQMIRAVCNMSDASQLGAWGNIKFELQNVTSVFDEIFEKAANLTKDADRAPEFLSLKENIDCVMDAHLLERAILNLISNAIKFSPVGSKIQMTLKKRDNRLMLTVKNNIQDGNSGIYGNAFSRFLRQPGLESGQIGIGLGMSIVSRAVAAHQGTVLFDAARKDCARVILSIPIRVNCDTTVKSPITLIGGYTGGFDSYLVELSDVLPDGFYENV